MPDIYQTEKEIEVLRDELKEIRRMLDNGELTGDLAEVGVYKGGTAKIIREEIPQGTLYLFDTFEGLPDQLHQSDAKHYYVGHCDAKEEFVKNHNLKNTVITKGVFPKTAGIIKDKRFSFVHIDVDIYQSTKEALEFFYPRMNIQGSIIIHDYPVHPGVAKAVDEFIDGKGTFSNFYWQQLGVDPLIQSGNRQLIIRRRI